MSKHFVSRYRLSRVVHILACAAWLTIPVLAHEGQHDGDPPANFHELWRAWEFDPLVVIGLALSAWLYFHGVRRLWRGAGVGSVIGKREAAAYAVGWLAIFVALVTPLHRWGEVLFSAHMTQHEVLMLVAAPLLVLGRPLVSYLWALPLGWRREVGGWSKLAPVRSSWVALKNPFAAWAIHAAALWVWHVPFLFQATLTSDFVHTLQHLSFLGSALLFWWSLIHGGRGLMGYGAAVLYVFATSIHSGALGALLTFATSVWYPAYAETTRSWGLTPLEDQQLGGLVMWIPAGLVYIAAGLSLFAGWMRESEKRVVRRERRAWQLEKQ